MRIDSTDASGMTSPRAKGSHNSTRDIRIDTRENTNISQMTDTEKRDLPISERVVIDAIEKANKAISGANRRFEFSIHEKTKEIIVKVIDSETNDVVREIPQEKILDMVAAMWEMAGIIVDERR